MLRSALLSLTLVALGGATALPAAAATAKRCERLPVAVALATTDPTSFQDDAGAIVTVASGAAVRDLRVEVRDGRNVVASGAMPGPVSAGRRVRVALKTVREVLEGGRYRVVVVGKRTGCTKRTSRARTWRFGESSLALRALPTSTIAEDSAERLQVVVHSVGGRRFASVRATLKNAGGATVAEAQRDTPFDGHAVLDLPVAAALAPGRYELELDGKTSSGAESSFSEPVVLKSREDAGSPPAATPAGPKGGVSRRNVTVHWDSGAWQGREAAGFVVPGIGHGEIVCRPDAQWIRFYPADGGREVTMLNWTYKDWAGPGQKGADYQEKSLREAIHTKGTGPDFREGFNKFSPPERQSTGAYEGIITDRGPIGGPGSQTAAPTTMHLSWEWDFADNGGRCHVQATFDSENDNAGAPLARSAQIVWRGEKNAGGRDEASVDVPGVGRVAITCRAGADASRTLTVDTKQGAKVTRREGSDEPVIDFADGPIVSTLPNNGMLAVRFAGGATMLVSSRWKGNDPEASENFCFIAAQVVVPG